MHKVIVAGSRTITDVKAIRKAMNEYWLEVGPYTVISGTARGVDTIAAIIAENAGIHVKEMPADWKKHGRSAGYRRNEDMAKEATHLLCLWDGESIGAKHMIDIAKREGLQVHVVVIGVTR